MQNQLEYELNNQKVDPRDKEFAFKLKTETFLWLKEMAQGDDRPIGLYLARLLEREQARATGEKKIYRKRKEK